MLESRLLLDGVADPDIVLSNSAVDKNQPEGTLVGSLSGAGENAVYELVSSSPFYISGHELRSAAPYNHENQSSYDIVIRAYPAEGPAFERTLQVSVGDIAEAPWIGVSSAGEGVYENQIPWTERVALQVSIV